MTLPFRRVWVTGASGGIGRALTLELSQQGAAVAATARSADKLDTLAGESGGSVTPLPADITDEDALQGVMDRIDTEWGGLDLAVLNAGTYAPVDLDSWNTKAFEDTFNLNVLGTVRSISAVLPLFRRQGRGHIAIVSSIAGLRGLPTGAAYGSSKAALTHLAECLKLEEPTSGIKVQVIHPGFVKTPLTEKNEFPMPFRIEAEDAAKRIVKGLCSNRFEITFPKRFTWLLKLNALLPDALYFPLVRKSTGIR